TPDDVYDSEDNHPHRVDEMPIHRQHLDSSRVTLSQISAECEQQHGSKCKQPDRNMERMQTDERVVSRREQVSLNCQPFVIDQVIPFAECACEECRSQGDG